MKCSEHCLGCRPGGFRGVGRRLTAFSLIAFSSTTLSLTVLALIGIGLAPMACGRPEARPVVDAAHDQHGEHQEGIVELSPEAAARVEIRTAPVERRALLTRLQTTGQVDFDQTRLAHVSPRITGRVHQVQGVLGEEVRAGETLAQIDSIQLGQAKAVYLQARAKEELTRKSFERAQNLFADRVASEQEVLETEAAWKEATAVLRSNEEVLRLYGLGKAEIGALSYLEQGGSIYPLRAPFAGTVVERHATLGELVTPERNLFTLADLSQVWIWIDVSQKDLGGVHMGDQARARVDAFPEEVFIGVVSYLSARVDANTRTVRARLEVANRDGNLRPGMFVEVELVDPHGKEGSAAQASSLVVPEDSVVREGDAFFVFVGVGDNRFQRKQIGIGRKAGGFLEALPDPSTSGLGRPGLAEGDPVVVEGAFLLKSTASKESLGGGHSH